MQLIEKSSYGRIRITILTNSDKKYKKTFSRIIEVHKAVGYAHYLICACVCMRVNKTERRKTKRDLFKQRVYPSNYTSTVC
jgi:hypothetical protein